MGNVLIFCLFVMERAGITRGYCHFVGKTMIKFSWDLEESWDYSTVKRNTNISLKTMLGV